ncbi:MAG: TIGR04282 family arsenosugar biosynthesis glycosyltransferase [Kiloniellales bacterium]|nr:TIGR04282 family arsenosugar biosynthesis glycosyltransferase [Kiloniellales bacterium]
MSLQSHLVVFARAPRLGRVKRRLARDLGPVAALRFHRLTTAGLLRRVARSPNWTTWLAVTPDREIARPRGLWATPARLRAQGPGDLGRRMGRVFRELPPGPVVIVGTDIPEISGTHVTQAFAALGRNDWVIGPASDGGYWLIGARRRPRLALPFRGVRWGGPHARADTLAGLGGQRVAFLEELDDVDTAADLARLSPGPRSCSRG